MSLGPYYVVEPARWWRGRGGRSRPRARDRREPVRQWALDVLRSGFGYPLEGPGARVELLAGGAFFGFACVIEEGPPFLVVSVGAPGEAGLAEAALRERLALEPCAGLGISTDGTEAGSAFLRRRFDRAGCDRVSDLEPRVRPARPARPGALAPLDEGVEGVFFEASSHVRDIDGLHADEALDELCKVLVARLHDETRSPARERGRLRRALHGSAEELAATARHVHRLATESLCRDDATSPLREPIRLSSPALARVLAALEGRSLARSPADVKGRAFQRVLVPAARAGMGQYFTPEAVVRFVVRVLEPSSGERVIDPFAGSGRFLRACLESSSPRVLGIEKSERMVRVALVDRLLHGEGGRLLCADALLDFSNYSDVAAGSFDVVVTNPPFGSVLGAEALGRLARFELAAGRSRVPLELLGLERAIELLRPGGRLGIVLPDSVLSNPGAASVRRWLEDRVRLRAVVSLPIETFGPFGANVKTSVVFARRRAEGRERPADHPVFLGRVDDVGHDAAGRPTSESDLDALAGRLLAFLREQGW